MGKIDIVIYIFLFLLIIIGYSKGFIKQILSTANWLVALIGTIVLIKPFTAIMMNSSVSTSVNKSISNWIASKGSSLAEVYDPNIAHEQISKAITEVLKLPSFLANMIANGINVSSTATNITLADVLAPSIGNIVMAILSFIILFLGLFIILKILIKLINLAFSGGAIGFTNHLLGAVLGFVKGVLIISLIMLGLNVLASFIPSLNQTLVNDFSKASWSIGKYIYEHNPLLMLIEKFFHFNVNLG